MYAPFVVQQRMEFIYDDGPGAHEQGRNLKAPENEQGLQGFRGDQQDPFRVGPGAGLHALRNIPVPRVDWKVRLLAEIFHSSQLVVYERLERGHVDQIESTLSWCGQHGGYKRKKCRLGLTSCRGSCDDQVSFAVQKCEYRALLNVVQLSPTLVPDPASDGLGEPVECGGWGCASADDYTFAASNAFKMSA